VAEHYDAEVRTVFPGQGCWHFRFRSGKLPTRGLTQSLHQCLQASSLDTFLFLVSLGERGVRLSPLGTSAQVHR
jgi:hypothetical protein